MTDCDKADLLLWRREATLLMREMWDALRLAPSSWETEAVDAKRVHDGLRRLGVVGK